MENTNNANDITQSKEVQALEKDEEAMKSFQVDLAREDYLRRAETGELTKAEKDARNQRLAIFGYAQEE